MAPKYPQPAPPAMPHAAQPMGSPSSAPHPMQNDHKKMNQPAEHGSGCMPSK